MGLYPQFIEYSDQYMDDEYEYRHVTLPRLIFNVIPKNHLLSEEEWKQYGVDLQDGFEHYMIHNPEPHILLMRRPLRVKNSQI